MAAGSAAGIKVIDSELGEDLMTIPAEGLRALSWSPNGNCLAALDGLGKIRYWDAAPGYSSAARGLDRKAAARLVFDRGLELAEQGEFDRAEATFREAQRQPSAADLHQWYAARMRRIRFPQESVNLEPGWDKTAGE
jgi:hypothetical protein